MKINKDAFLKLLEPVSLKEFGDPVEREQGNLITDLFPNYEIYWRNLVVPVTRRINSYPQSISHDAQMRQEINEQVEDAISSSYTCFVHLVRAQTNYTSQETGYLENIYSHLGSAYDLAESFLEINYLLLLDCTDGKSEILQHLKKEDFIKIAEEWYEKNYKEFHTHYLSKGKNSKIHLPSRKNILKEFIVGVLGDKALWKEYNEVSSSIRTMRNAIVHDVTLGQIIINGGVSIMPKPSVIQNYRTWRSIRAVTEEPNIAKINKDFTRYPQQAKSDIDSTKVLMNKIWEKIIVLMHNELYKKENPKLLAYYQLELG